MASLGAGSGSISSRHFPLICFLVGEYQPISCMQHERLEFSVLRKIPLQLEYHRGLEKIRQIVMPLDVETRSGAEWLKFRVADTAEVVEIRLDSIISFAENLPS